MSGNDTKIREKNESDEAWKQSRNASLEEQERTARARRNKRRRRGKKAEVGLSISKNNI